MRHTIAYLLEIKNVTSKINFIKEMLISAKSDGWRFHQKILKQYRCICCNTEEKPKEFFEHLLEDFKRTILNEILEKLYGVDVTLFDQATKDLSEKLGIPPLRDSLETSRPDMEYDKDKVVLTFYEKATPQTFLFEYLLPLYTRDGEVRDVCREALKEFIPPSWVIDPSGTQRTKSLIFILEHLELFRSSLNVLSPQKILPALSRTRSFIETLFKKTP